MIRYFGKDTWNGKLNDTFEEQIHFKKEIDKLNDSTRPKY